jgi:transcriptional regulator with GAF, ATPase, and Fis domain
MYNTKSPEEDQFYQNSYIDSRLNRTVLEDSGPEIGFTDKAQNAVFKSLKKVIKNSYTRNELFIKLTSRLDKFFSINRASMAFYEESRDLVSIPYMMANREYKSGVQINFVATNSIITNVLLKRKIFVRDFPHFLAINELEKKILLDRESNCLAVVPLVCGEELVGTLNFASASYFAFSLLESHLLDYLFERTAEKLLELPR